MEFWWCFYQRTRFLTPPVICGLVHRHELRYCSALRSDNISVLFLTLVPRAHLFLLFSSLRLSNLLKWKEYKSLQRNFCSKILSFIEHRPEDSCIGKHFTSISLKWGVLSGNRFFFSHSQIPGVSLFPWMCSI